MPQIEIMQSDLPHTLYKNQKKKDKADPNDEAFRLQEEANKRYAEKKASQERAYTIDEVFSGAADE